MLHFTIILTMECLRIQVLSFQRLRFTFHIFHSRLHLSSRSNEKYVFIIFLFVYSGTFGLDFNKILKHLRYFYS